MNLNLLTDVCECALAHKLNDLHNAQIESIVEIKYISPGTCSILASVPHDDDDTLHTVDMQFSRTYTIHQIIMYMENVKRVLRGGGRFVRELDHFA